MNLGCVDLPESARCKGFRRSERETVGWTVRQKRWGAEREDRDKVTKSLG